MGLILMTSSESTAQSWRLLNPKSDLRLNGLIGPPMEYDEIEQVKLFDSSNDKVLVKQVLILYHADYFNQIDNDPELYCLAQNSYWESRGETFQDKLAVANVVLNRVKDPRYPKTICRVVRDKCQFSWHCAGLNRVPVKVTENNKYDIKVLPWVESVIAAMVAKNSLMPDLTKGATHFYAHKIVRPNWALPNYITTKTSGHTFVKLPCKDC